MRFLIAVFAVFIFAIQPAIAHQHGGVNEKALEEVTIEKLSDAVSMIQAGGGNIAVFHGKDGVFVIDNGLADKRDAVKAALHKIIERPVSHLVNTHWHYDHAGNNELFGKDHIIMLAHENVRKRLKSGGAVKAFDKEIEPANNDALPTLTYEEGINVYLNGQAIKIHALDPAHTDGDSFIIFPEENIIHTGDIFFNGFWPFIDGSSGGSLRGMIKAANEIYLIADEDTKIIPGHGSVASKEDLKAYYDMLVAVEGRVKAAKDQGKTAEQWMESKPFADLDVEWGQGFLNTDQFTAIVWDAY